jgi:protein-disulfide isomerase
MENVNFQRKIHWYQTVWGVVVIGLAVLVGAVLVMFILLTTHFIFKIRAGEKIDLTPRSYIAFTPLSDSSVSSNIAVNRIQLEQGDFFYLGSKDAPITVVEFVDLKCPNCRLAYPIMKDVLRKYGQKFKLIIRHLPIESLHPGTSEFSKFAWCSRAQGKFLAVYEYAFTTLETISEAWGVNEIDVYAKKFDLDKVKIRSCMESPGAAQAIGRDASDALSAGARGTPTFFINGVKIEGVPPMEFWDRQFEK